MKKNVIIFGHNGFVGKNLSKFFTSLGYSIVGIDRKEMSLSDEELIKKIDGSEAVINLAGAPIIKRWTDKYKRVLRSSRIDTTSRIVYLISKTQQKPKIFFSTSAIGIYGGDAVFVERDKRYSDDFLSILCQDWENSALSLHSQETRVAIFRFGVVLGRNGGALKQMLFPFKLGLGGEIGDGKAPFSFIHIDDLLRSYQFVLENKSLEGVFNLTAPEPTTNGEMTKVLGKILHRPTFFRVPKFILKLIYSDGAKVLTDGQKVIPERLLEAGFEFQFPNIEKALKDLV
jgi:hypothetical protein